MFIRHVITMLLMLLSGAVLASSPAVQWTVEANIKPTYQQGDADEITITLRAVDPSGQFREGVAFLNVVENSRERNWPQAAHKIFAWANEDSRIFQLPLSREAWQEGQHTTLSFRLKRNARPGDYVLVLRLFNGPNTNPHTVQTTDLLGHADFRFSITPR